MGGGTLFRTLRILGVAAAASLFAASSASAACGDASAACGATIAPSCLNRVGAGTLAADAPADCDAQFEAYRVCLADFAQRCGDAAPAASSERAIGPPPGHAIVAEASRDGSRFLFVIAPAAVTWSAAEQAATAMGGRLAVLDTPAKQEAVSTVLARRPELFVRTQFLLSGWFHGPWLGGFQLSGSAEPSEGWVWSVDPSVGAIAPISGGRWYLNQPDEFGGAANYLNVFCIDQPTCDTWNDAPHNAPVRSYIVETPL